VIVRVVTTGCHIPRFCVMTGFFSVKTVAMTMTVMTASVMAAII